MRVIEGIAETIIRVDNIEGLGSAQILLSTKLKELVTSKV